MSGKTDYLHVRVTPELKASIKLAARRRSLDASALIGLVLSDWIARDEKQRIDLSGLVAADVDPDDAT